MKKIKLTFVFALFACATMYISSCTKTETAQPNQQQTGTNNTNEPEDKLTFTKKTRPVLLEITSTGCPGCGSWGKPTFKKLVNDFGNDITPLAVHIKYGDPMITAESQAIADNRHGSRYTPQIWVGDMNAIILTGGSISSASEQNARDLMNAGQGVDQPAVAASIKKEGGKLNVTYGVKFIDVPTDGEYALACYLTEDGLSYNQSSSASNPTTHNQVLRASADGAFGKAFTSADLMDNEVTWQFSFDLSDYNETNTYITVVLWKKDGNRYVPVNGYIAK